MFGAGGGFNFGAAPTTSATGTSQAKPGFTFGGTATTAAGGFNFGQPGQSTAAASGLKTDAAPTQSGFTFGTTPNTSTTAPTGGFNFGTTSTSGAGGSAGGSGGGFSFGQSTATSGPSSSGFSFASPAGGPGVPGLGALGTSTTTAPTAGSSGFALGAATAAATPFGAATKTTTSGLAGFGIPSTTTKPEGGFTGSTGLGGAGTTTATASTAPSAGAFSLSVGSTSALGVSTAAPVNPLLGSLLSNNPSSTVATGFSLAAPATTSVTGLSGAIPKTTPAASSTSTGTTTAGGLGGFGLTTSTAAITTSTTAAPTVTTSGGAPTGVPSRLMNYRQLEEQINKWMLELEEQEKEFLQQATQVNAWDRLLIENGEKITQLNQDTDKVRVDQDRLDHELDFIKSQQRELEDLLVPLEKSVEQLPGYSFQHHADLERENTYQLADNIDAQLKRMVQDLKEIIDHLNTSNSGQESNDPIQQITKILNAHMDSLQWLDSNTALIGRRVEDISKKMETQRKEQERNFRLVYD